MSPFGLSDLIIVKSKGEIEKIRSAGRIVAETFELLKDFAKPGVTTKDIDRASEEYIRKKGGLPAFKGYRGYPASACTSINNQVIHGIPSSRRLKSGDIIGIDLGVNFEGFFGDAAVTFAVGEISGAARRLMQVTEEALYRGLSMAKSGNRVSDISHGIQAYAESRGYSVVRSFTGHGVGRALHEEPQIPNYGPPGKGPRLKAGMVLAIEPMINAGGWEVDILGDGWTAVTRDGSLSAHFEHTVAVTDGEVDILTKTV